MISVISGIYRQRKLATPGEGTHPMGERERNALFNMIADNVQGALVADLYAGSGALGIEALSRGAEKCVFVEKNPAAMKVIRNNCLTLGIPEEKFSFYLGSVQSFCKKVDPERYTIVLADPPYDNFKEADLTAISDLIKAEGILVLSHPEEALVLPGLTLEKTKKYAGAHISIYNKE